MRKSIQRNAHWVLLVGLMLVAQACGDSSDDASSDVGSDGVADGGGDGSEDQGEAEDPAADGCEHMAGGPFADVTAAATADGTLPDVSAGHTAHRIALVGAGSEMYEGYVRYVSDADTERAMFLSAQVALELTDAEGTVLAPTDSGNGTDQCTEVGSWAHYDFSVGTYTVHLGPTTEASVTLVTVTPGDPGHEHEH